MSDINALLKGTTRRTKRATVCLRGDLSAEYDALEDQLRHAEACDTESFDGGAARPILKKLEALREQMAAAEVTLEFAALPPMRPLELLAEHAPRGDNDADKALGYNQVTYYPALIRESCVSVTAHDGTTAPAGDIDAAAWDAMLTEIGHLDFDALVGAAMEANGRASVPFSRLASQTSQSSESDSRRPKRGGSPRGGSTGGNRKSSGSSSTTKAAG